MPSRKTLWNWGDAAKRVRKFTGRFKADPCPASDIRYLSPRTVMPAALPGTHDEHSPDRGQYDTSGRFVRPRCKKAAKKREPHARLRSLTGRRQTEWTGATRESRRLDTVSKLFATSYQKVNDSYQGHSLNTESAAERLARFAMMAASRRVISWRSTPIRHSSSSTERRARSSPIGTSGFFAGLSSSRSIGCLSVASLPTLRPPG